MPSSWACTPRRCTPRAYWNIPYIRRKVDVIKQRSGFDSSAHLGKELAQVLEVLPRDDLFQTPVDDLFNTALSIVQIQERNKIRVFLRRDPYGRFCYCLAYVPRDVYSTETRMKIQQVLMERLQATDCQFWTVLLRVGAGTRAVHPARRPEEQDPDRPGASGEGGHPGLPFVEGRLRQPDGRKPRRSPGHQRPGRFPAASRPATASASPRTRRWWTCSTCSA